MSATFVFVDGGFGSPDELAPAIPFLEAHGHRVINVDLPCERPQSTLDDYANAVAQAMAGSAGPHILVGHSVGDATMEHVTIDNGDSTRSFDFDALSALAPPEKRDAYLNFLRGT